LNLKSEKKNMKQSTSSSSDKEKTATTAAENLPKKIVIRRLPPALTKEQFLDIVSPVPEHDYFYFCSADMRLAELFI
jgi:regulator of nonsense transcripts 3